jgi:GTP-binding protein EngB required for normal cell division
MGPATAFPIEYRYNEAAWKITQISKNHEVDQFQYANLDELSVELRDKAFIRKGRKVNNTRWLTVEGPMRLLGRNLSLVDTPGFGAVTEKDEHEADADTLSFINERIHRVYFCLSGSNKNISDVERDFYKSIATKCGHIIVTKWDFKQSDTEKTIFRDTYGHLFKNAHFIFTNAKESLTGKGLGVSELQQIIEDNADEENRSNLLHEQVLRAWNHINFILKKIHDLNQIPWRKDSLERLVFKSNGLFENAAGLN